MTGNSSIEIAHNKKRAKSLKRCEVLMKLNPTTSVLITEPIIRDYRQLPKKIEMSNSDIGGIDAKNSIGYSKEKRED